LTHTADPATGRPRERGFALLIVLWMLVLIALLTTHILANGRVETRLAANLRGSAEAEAAADGAVFDTAFRLLQAGLPLRVARKVLVLPLHRGTATVAIEPESGKINPNIAEPELLAALFRTCGADIATGAALAAAVDGWRTPGPQSATLATQLGAAGLDYGPPGAPFETLDEIGLVPGMNASLLACMLPHLSLYQTGDPNPAAADPVVLAALKDLASGQQFDASESEGNVAVSITATVVLASGARFVRHAIIGLGPSASGFWYRVLVWDVPQL
jgi:general secretion pathway protein K